MYAKSRETGNDAINMQLSIDPFNLTLSKHGLQLTRSQTTTLQANIGLICNQYCRHCHLDAGPDRTETMSSNVMDQVAAYAERCAFEIIDVTGGAPELHPDLGGFLARLSSLSPRVLLRSNLTALYQRQSNELLNTLADNKIAVFASFPSVNATQSDSQRGSGIFLESIAALKQLNKLGYGKKSAGLELNLVSNPTGAFVPAPQNQMEKRFRDVLQKKHGIIFNNLFNFGNVPIGRFRQWLIRSGNYDAYMQKLYASFNPCAIEGLMCRTLVSVNWDGFLYDCDFNLARGLYMGGRKMHVSEMTGLPEPEGAIALSDHCYTCTAGEGFT